MNNNDIIAIKTKEYRLNVGDKVQWIFDEEKNLLLNVKDSKSTLQPNVDYTITGICQDYDMLQLDISDLLWFRADWFKRVVYDYEIGKEYIFSDSLKELETSKIRRELKAIWKDEKCPYITKSFWSSNGYTGYRYIKPIEEFEPYDKLDLDWLGKEILFREEPMIISSFCPNNIFRLSRKEDDGELMRRFSLKNMFENFKWVDGSICGKIKR